MAEPRNPAQEFVTPDDPIMSVEAQKHVIKELTHKIQFLVEWMDQRGLLEDHSFTFPDGDLWKAQDLPKEQS